MNEIEDKIKRRSRELEFDDCRITTAASPESADHLRDWLDEGRHGEMGYLERNAHKRVDPQLVLQNARSVISLAAAYSGFSGAGCERF